MRNDWWAVLLSALSEPISLNLYSTGRSEHFMKAPQRFLGWLLWLADLYFWGGNEQYTKVEMVCIDRRFRSDGRDHRGRLSDECAAW